MLGDALEGERNFMVKRETVDEYGWRHFGDTWADHEEVYSEERRPVMSHFNNQYDLLYGLLVQLLSSGDGRWWSLASPLARHLMDIDIYHTDRDKPAYNGGLFWHTDHYHDAATSTHRSMSLAMLERGAPAPGGGPAAEHNYASGLALYFCLTGCSRARDTVVGLADWVIRMDDGSQHVFGVLTSTPTGHASRTNVADYHGPGRGVGNSINVLMDGWAVSGEEKYLSKIEELIQRTIHPRDNLEAMGLDNAELRWSYTVFLQALVRYLWITAYRQDLSPLRSYVRAALLHYSEWMVANERFYLDEPEKLEYPTETWAAQELRKGTTLMMVARLARGPRAEALESKAQEILDRSWRTLLSFESRDFTRPLALVLQQGYLETFFSSELTTPLEGNFAEAGGDDFGELGVDGVFIDQRQFLRNAANSPLKMLGCAPNMIRPSRWLNLVKQTWFSERLRHWGDHWLR